MTIHFLPDPRPAPLLSDAVQRVQGVARRIVAMFTTRMTDRIKAARETAAARRRLREKQRIFSRRLPPTFARRQAMPVVPNRGETMTTIPEGYWKDGKGNLVPIANIKQIDILRDELVKKIVLRGHMVSEELAKFKAEAFSEIDAFIELSFSEYQVLLGGKKGNITLHSYEQRYKLEIQVAERIAFDERLQAAKQLIDECIRKWGADAHPGLMTLINDAFQVDKTGKVSTSRVMGLRRHAIDDETWKRAMEAISDSMQTVGSKRYLRLYERINEADEYRPVPLDLASL